VLAIFVIGSMIILIYCAEVHQSATYQDVVYACCGRMMRILCSITVALYAFGTCVTFFIIIGDQWDKCELMFQQGCSLLLLVLIVNAKLE
jgi:sodium-coupled neutral amino acid transporter 7/8